MDPEVVTQFNCLQQTGDFCPSASTGPAAMSSSSTTSPTPMSTSTASSPTMSALTTPSQAAVDALFALMGTPNEDLGSLGASSPSHRGH